MAMVHLNMVQECNYDDVTGQVAHLNIILLFFQSSVLNTCDDGDDNIVQGLDTLVNLSRGHRRLLSDPFAGWL